MDDERNRYEAGQVGCLFSVLSSLMCIYGLIASMFSSMSIGMMGGDCPERLSYGSISIAGQVVDGDGNPLEGVTVAFLKEEGICPQSVRGHVVVESDAEGAFSGGFSVHLGDPAVQGRVIADGYDLCEFSFSSASTQSAEVILKIILAEDIHVQGVVYGYWVGDSDVTISREFTACS
jgi:hypothetical protein